MTYLTQSVIADDPHMRLRIAQAAASEGVTEAGLDPDAWMITWRRLWAAAPGWDAQWESSQAANPPISDPGKDPGVITDAQILSQVQSMKPFVLIGA